MPRSLLFKLGIILLLQAPSLLAATGEPITLRTYIEMGRAAGLNIVYSSSLVTGGQTVPPELGDAFSIEQLKAVLETWQLELEELGPDSYLLRRRTTAPQVRSPGDSKDAPTLEEVVIHSSRYQWSRGEDGSARMFTAAELIKRPVVANDALRVANQLPGSASVGISARPRVRGGRENETLIEFDSVRLYDPFHFANYNSLYSVFDERLLGELEIFSGAYPMQFGDRLSAAMSIRPPRREELEDRREVGVGTYQISYLHSAVATDSSLLFSVRRSGLESGRLLEGQDLGHPEYADAYARYERDREAGGRWSANLLWYADDLSLNGRDGGETTESQFSSGYAWLKLSAEEDAQLYSELTVGVGYAENRRRGEVEQPDKVRGALDNDLDFLQFFANQDFEISGPQGQLSFGWDYRYLRAAYDYQSTRWVAPAFAGLSNISREPVEFYDGSQRAQQGAVYLGWKQLAWGRLYVDAGLRLDAQDYATRSDLEPAYRVALLWPLHTRIDLRISAGRYTQSMGLHEIPVADGESEVFPGQAATQLVVALDMELPFLEAVGRVEAYRKDADEVTPYFDNLSNPFTLLPELQPDRTRVEPERYRASGVEFSLDIPFSWGELWANFAYSSAKDRVEGRSVRRSWDQGRTFNLGGQTRLGEWDLSLSAGFHEGWLTTPLRWDQGQVTAAARNSERFDHFLSVDVKAVRRWKFGAHALRLETGVSNLSDRQNIAGIDYLPGDQALIQQPFYAPPRNVFADLYWSF